jgi:hypothetical protein
LSLVIETGRWCSAGGERRWLSPTPSVDWWIETPPLDMGRYEFGLDAPGQAGKPPRERPPTRTHLSSVFGRFLLRAYLQLSHQSIYSTRHQNIGHSNCVELLAELVSELFKRCEQACEHPIPLNSERPIQVVAHVDKYR